MSLTAYGLDGSVNVLPMICVVGTYGDVPNTTRCFYLVKGAQDPDWNVCQGDDIDNEYEDFKTPDELAAEIMGSLTGEKKARVVGRYTSEPSLTYMKTALLSVYA